MIFSNNNGLKLAHFENILRFKNEVTHFVTTRYDADNEVSFNLNLDKNNNTAYVLENREKLAKTMGLSTNDFVFPIQVHGINTPRVFDTDRGKGSQSAADSFQETDGFITNVPKLCLIAFAADCVPIVFFDPVKRAIGVAHAGWKGTALRIPAFLIDRMVKEFGTNPADLIVGIGPSGGPCCYEVGDDVIAEVAKNFDLKKVIKNMNGLTTFDMWEANRITLTQSGVLPENIEISGICTISQNDLFFSARKGDTERFVAGIFLT